MASLENVLDWRGREMVDPDGAKIGKIEEIYVDQQTDEPEWALVNTGLFAGKSTFVPLSEATEGRDDVRVPFPKDHIKDAPRMDPSGELTRDEEAELYRHYGLDYGEGRSGSGLPEGGGDVDRDRDETVGRDTSGPETDSAMTRSEEELKVGTTQRETGRARLKKYVVTEDVQTTVPVQREEVRIEREPITDANVGDATSGGELTEEEHEVTLSAEEVVVDKQVVPKERVRMDKDTVQEERQVSESVAKEQIDIEGDGEANRR